MEILTAGIKCGSEVTICYDGIDEVAAMNKVKSLFNNRFGE